MRCLLVKDIIGRVPSGFLNFLKVQVFLKRYLVIPIIYFVLQP